MPAGQYDIIIEQGARYYRKIVWKDSAGTLKDLTGYTLAMKIRKRFASSTVILDASSYLSAPTPANGEIIINIPASATAGLSFIKAVYDIELTSGTTVIRLLQGTATLSQEATK